MSWHAMAGGTIRNESGIRRIAFVPMALASYALCDAGAPTFGLHGSCVAIAERSSV